RRGLLAVAQLKETAAPEQARGRVGPRKVDEALRLLPPGVAAAGLAPAARRQHTELPAAAILHRRCAIGIKRVAFVQHGVGHLLYLVEHQPAPPQLVEHQPSATWEAMKSQNMGRPVPFLVETWKSRASGFARRMLAMHCSRSKSRCGSRSTLVKTTI